MPQQQSDNGGWVLLVIFSTIATLLAWISVDLGRIEKEFRSLNEQAQKIAEKMKGE